MPNLTGYNWKAIFSNGVQTTRTNLSPNPSFEANTTSWSTAQTSISRSTSFAKFGNASGKITVTNSASSQLFSLPAGTLTFATTGLYTLSLYVYVPVGSTIAGRTVQMSLEGGTMTHSGGTNTAVTLVAGSWVRVAFIGRNFTNVSGTSPAMVIRLSGTMSTAIGQDVYCDANLVEFSSSLQSYFDGSTFDPATPPEYIASTAWTGTASNSTSTAEVQNWYQLPDIQTVDIFKGRRLQIDDYGIDTCTIGSIDPTGWTNTPKLGDQITVYVDAPGYVTGVSEFSMFVGRIRDVDIQYGYVPNEDYVTVSCEGLQGDWGRAQLNSFSVPQQLTDETILDIGTQVGLNTAQFFGRSTNSAITFTGNAFDLVNGITRTEEARMLSYAESIGQTPYLWWFGRNNQSSNTFTFSDGTVTIDLLQQKYAQIEFRSSADNYYNQVTVRPEAVAAQTATLSTTPIYSQDKDTYDYSTAQAADHANWLLQNFQNKNQAIASITFTEIQQSTTYGTGAANARPLLIGGSAINNEFTIGFRGSTYYTVGEGIRISARPGQTTFTIFMSGQDQNAYLILDDAVYGKLDSNKLGY